MPGKWVQEEPSGCATKCGVGLGMSGTPGTVKCSTSSCDAETKPAAKKCPKTVDCGELRSVCGHHNRDIMQFDSGMKVFSCGLLQCLRSARLEEPVRCVLDIAVYA